MRLSASAQASSPLPPLLLLLLSGAPTTVYASALEHTCAKQDSGMEAVFECGGKLISKVEFASYGTPKGTCSTGTGVIGGAEKVKDCDASNAIAAVEDRCLGQSTCMFTVTPEMFSPSPSCRNTDSSRRWLLAQLRCGGDDEGATVVAPERGLGIGWQFVILVFAFFFLYFGLGMAYKVKREGAKLNSMEAIPHVEMWKELPYLVRDGVIFSIDTIKSKGRPNYDSVGSL